MAPLAPGDVCIVTGANSGIGKEVAAGLMARGARVVLACRDMAACERAAAELSARHPGGACECSRLDLADQQSVRDFAARARADLAAARRPLKVLVNNAGVMGPPPLPGGREPHLVVNHLGPYLLTRLLLPALPRDGSGRVVSVASRASYWGDVRVAWRQGGGGGGECGAQGGDGGGSGRGGERAVAGGGGGGAARDSSGGGGGRWVLEEERRGWFRQYARSKLLNVLFTAELQRRYGPGAGAPASAAAAVAAAGPGAAPAVGDGGGRGARPRFAAASVSPGMVGTSIFRRLPWPLCYVERPMRLLARRPARGAETAVWAATDAAVRGGAGDLFLHDCAPLAPAALALDAELARRVWDASATAVGLPPGDDDC